MDFKYRNKLISQYRKKGMDKKEATDLVTDWYLDYKNGINNSRNFQIQSLAGSIVNRAAISIQRAFDDKGIDAWVCAQIHDQLIFDIPKAQQDECLEIIQSIMEGNYKLSLDLKAPPELSLNWRDGH
jgi:DNA polymerase I-like protein with 3'-5' exonuclease and polymerase domains